MSAADPRNPRLLRGALVSIDPVIPIPKLVVFQYNPDSVTRSLAARVPNDAGSRLTATRLAGAPQETIKMDIEIDATDQLEKSDPVAMALGIYPQLSTLEMLVYPSSIEVIANTVLLATGTIELLPPPAPLTLLIWGVKRVVPVRLSEFTITEQGARHGAQSDQGQRRARPDGAELRGFVDQQSRLLHLPRPSGDQGGHGACSTPSTNAAAVVGGGKYRCSSEIGAMFDPTSRYATLYRSCSCTLPGGRHGELRAPDSHPATGGKTLTAAHP